jgi:predicted ABC-type ATPase
VSVTLSPCITVIAGTNGSGKSSIAGAAMRDEGGEYFNPDEVARARMAADPSLSQREANGEAWQIGKTFLERAIRERRDFIFETTLGGNTITALLLDAIASGLEVRIWYAGLSSPALHIQRVKSRVAQGGHAIPDADIYKRYDASRLNLIRLLPALTELRVFDNSDEADPSTGLPPMPRLVLHVESGKIMNPSDLGSTPEWAKPIVAAAMKASGLAPALG